MAVSRPQQIAKDKYRQEKRDQITAEVPKGKRDAYKLIAAELNLSLSMLIQNGVEEYGRNHAGKDFLPTLPTPEAKSLSPADERLLDDLAKLPPDAQKAFRQLVRAITAPANDDDQRRQKN